MPQRFRLGLDTGGTYTDAVIVDQNLQVVASAKALTTHHDLSQGLGQALKQVMHGFDGQISLVCLSTTLATNALVEGRGRPIGLLLLGYREIQLNRSGLKNAVAGVPVFHIAGGHDAAGNAICDLDEVAVVQAVERCRNQVEAFAISGLFAVRNPAHERRVRELVHQGSDLPTTCGHELSAGLDAPRRALTAVLNARLIPMISGLLNATATMLKQAGIAAPLMVVKGDGSLITASVAAETPVETILSGPAASVAGAQFLVGGIRRVVVSDMGGTTTDIAHLSDGHPELDPDGATVGGWRTMVNAVKIHTVGLGGDSAVRYDRIERDIDIGPDRWLPLVRLVGSCPGMLQELEQQAEADWVPTWAGQFALVNTETRPTGLSRQQMELYTRLHDQPVSLVKLFEDQTLERALTRLIERGLVLISGFTPTDACKLADARKTDEPISAPGVQAVILGARLLMRYSAANLGRSYTDENEFAGQVIQRVAELTACALVETAIAAERKRPQYRLADSARSLLKRSFVPRPSGGAFSLQARLHDPVVGIGAPVARYYPGVGRLLATEILLPAHHEVANALGAAVGSVRPARTWVITPVGGNQVRVHAPAGPELFDDLEAAVSWAKTELETLVADLALAYGAETFSLEFDRHDNTVVKDGQSVFFESRLTVRADGRPRELAQKPGSGELSA